MKTTLVRIDLSSTAGDFRPIAIEPGVPMLDQSGANARVLSQWLGRFVGEPDWDGDSVHYTLQDEPLASQPKITCRPVTARRLAGVLQAEFDTLRTRLGSVKPTSRDEQFLFECVFEAFRAIESNPNRSDIGCYLLEYRDIEGKWRLLWCWGYQRVDKSAASAALCGRSDCRLLYLHRRGKSGKCPICRPYLTVGSSKPGCARRSFLLMILTAIALFLVYWFFGARIQQWLMPIGGRLEITPSPIVVFLGGTAEPSSVRILPDDGGPPVPVDYRLEPEGKQQVVQIESNRLLHGLAEGEARLRVTSIDSKGPFDGFQTHARVRVVRLKGLRIEPTRVSVRVDEVTPRFVTTGLGDNDTTARVDAKLTCLNEEILAPDPEDPGRFLARSLGGTSVRAEYLSQAATANVSVLGERFTKVDTTLNEGSDDFNISIEVFAERSVGDLEYRVFQKDGTPPETWTPSEDAPPFRRVVLQSEPMEYGPPSTIYRLILEARDPADASIDRYLFTFHLGLDISRVK